jgi:hypothetical protein
MTLTPLKVVATSNQIAIAYNKSIAQNFSLKPGLEQIGAAFLARHSDRWAFRSACRPNSPTTGHWTYQPCHIGGIRTFGTIRGQLHHGGGEAGEPEVVEFDAKSLESTPAGSAALWHHELNSRGR